MDSWTWRYWSGGKWRKELVSPENYRRIYLALRKCETHKDFAKEVRERGATGLNILQLHDGQCIVGLWKQNEFKWKVYPDLDTAMVAVELNWGKGD